MNTFKFFVLVIIFALAGCKDNAPSGPIVGGPTNDDDGGGGPTTNFLKDQVTFPIGNIVEAGKLTSTSSDNVTFREVLLDEFNSITAENDMKMAEIFRGPDNYNFDKGDAIVAYAKENGLRVHGHTLIWHSSVPGWLNSFSGSDAEFETLIENYIKATVSHFAAAKDGDGNSIVASWDVLNEYFDGGAVRNTLFLQRMGSDYHEKIFTWAREADPDVKLIYNDYNLAGDPAKRNNTIAMIEDLQSKSVPIDGIGLQMHLNHDWPTNDLETAVQDAANTGLLVHVSELDVKVNYNNDVTELTSARSQAQAYQYQRVTYYYKTIIPSSQQFGITLWGFRDEDSWIYKNTGGNDWPLLFDTDFNYKEAYMGFLNGLKGLDPE